MADSFKRFSTVFNSSWIDIGTSWDVNKVLGRTQKLQIERSLLAGNGFSGGIVFESLLKNPFNGVNIKLFEVQCSQAGGIQPLGTIAFGQADQLLRGAEPAPRKLAG